MKWNFPNENLPKESSTKSKHIENIFYGRRLRERFSIIGCKFFLVFQAFYIFIISIFFSVSSSLNRLDTLSFRWPTCYMRSVSQLFPTVPSDGHWFPLWIPRSALFAHCWVTLRYYSTQLIFFCCCCLYCYIKFLRNLAFYKPFTSKGCKMCLSFSKLAEL